MKLNVFGKKGKSKEGRDFPIFLSTMTKKDGTKLGVSIKFRQECGQPDLKDCPCVVEIAKDKANLEIRQIRDQETGEYVYDENTGEIKEGRTLWVSDWKMVGPYVDNSLDDFED